MDVFSLFALIGTLIIASSLVTEHRKISSSTSIEHRQSAESFGGEPQKCDCTPLNLCKTYKSDTESDIDIRHSGPCVSYLEVCCLDKSTNPEDVSSTNSRNEQRPYTPYEFVTPDDGSQKIISASQPTTEQITNNREQQYYDYDTDYQCGVWNKNGVGFRIYNNLDGETQFGEFPSVVAIFKEEKSENGDKKLEYHCGGSLIKPNVVLTTTHCVININPTTLVVRAGEWDLKSDAETFNHQDLYISDVVTHPKYTSSGLYNDIALIFTDKSFTLTENVQTLCLPEENDDYTNSRCFSAGWGKTVSYNNYSIERKTKAGIIVHDIGQYEVSIMKKVELPIVDHETCMESLKATRLGPNFKLHSSFMCAGGEHGKDTCKGDGGSPLMCPSTRNPNYLVQIGIVAWGIECGLENIPGVYVNVAGFRQWIDKEIFTFSLNH